MLISNTATVALMAPIAVGIVRQIDAAADQSVENLHTATLLGVAYAGSIGGIGTLVGTPPNAIVFGTGEVTRGQCSGPDRCWTRCSSS